MNKIKANGNIKSTAQPEGKTIEFPVTFELKAVLSGLVSDADNKKSLTTVFIRLKVKHDFRHKTVSSKGTYASFTYEVTLNSKQQMDQLYAGLKQLEGLKFAL
ncbi:MAG: DUF493 domain-containing protein [Bacteroidales bacterium]|nr:DUF493 domain-containing protein [Bacteroidales bacterium]